MKALLDIAAVIASAFAAVLWFCSAMIKTPSSFSVEVVSTVKIDPEAPSSEGIGEGFGTSKELTALGNALICQSRLSAAAAFFAGVATVCQAVSLKISN